MSGRRPTTGIPEWATDLTPFAAPGEDWDGQPRKVNPGDAKRAAGFDCDEQPGTQELNYHLHSIGEHTKGVTRLPELNFAPSVSPGIALHDVTFSQALTRRRYYAVGVNSSGFYEIRSSPNCIDWFSEDVGGSASWALCALALPSGPVLVGGSLPTAATIRRSTTLGSWANVTVTGLDVAYDMARDPISGLIVLVGEQSGAPGIWYSTDEGATWTASHPPNGVANMDHAVFVECYGERRFVVCGLEGSSCYVWEGDGDFWTAHEVSSTKQARGMAWSPELKTMMIVFDSSFPDVAIATSADWSAWAPRTVPGLALGLIATGLVNLGGLWIFPTTNSSTSVTATDTNGWLYLSYDLGESWTPVHATEHAVTRPGIGTSEAHRRITTTPNGRILVWGAPAAGSGQLARSLMAWPELA